MAIPPSVSQLEQVTAEMLGGATPAELAAFRMAALQAELDLEVSERTAILVLYGDGTDWRERVAERVPVGWGALTGELDLRPPGMRAAGKTHDVPGKEHTASGPENRPITGVSPVHGQLRTDA